MRFSIATVFAFASTISAAYNTTNDHSTVYITEVHTAYTTFCPSSTELVYNGVTYTATEVIKNPLWFGRIAINT